MAQGASWRDGSGYFVNIGRRLSEIEHHLSTIRTTLRSNDTEARSCVRNAAASARALARDFDSLLFAIDRGDAEKG